MMGQAKLRGSFDVRQAEGIIKRIEREKAYAKLQHQRQEYWQSKMKESSKELQSWLIVSGIVESFRK
jgi:hypothetical protein